MLQDPVGGITQAGDVKLHAYSPAAESRVDLGAVATPDAGFHGGPARELGHDMVDAVATDDAEAVVEELIDVEVLRPVEVAAADEAGLLEAFDREDARSLEVAAVLDAAGDHV